MFRLNSVAEECSSGKSPMEHQAGCSTDGNSNWPMHDVALATGMRQYEARRHSLNRQTGIRPHVRLKSGRGAIAVPGLHEWQTPPDRIVQTRLLT